MSAFLCTPEHLAALVDYGYQHDGSHSSPVRLESPEPLRVSDQQHTMSVLLEENLKSLRARYGEKSGSVGAWADPEPLYSYRTCSRRTRTWKPVEVIKLCHCYAYQACEHEGWAESEAKRFIDRLEHKAIRNLPGYDDAPWGL